VTRLLITGGSSYLGRHLTPPAAVGRQVTYTYYTHDPLNLPGGVRLDLRDATAVTDLIRRTRPEAIIHTAGSNRVDDMHTVIVAGTRHVAQAAEAVNARLIHLSTDVVFNGRCAPYRESDPPTPLHAYGQAKAAAEEIVRTYSNHVIIRTSLIYGLEQMDRGTAWIAGALRAGQPVTLFTDQMRNPVWVQTLCQACLELAGADFVGVLNVAGRQALSRADFALRLLDWWGVQERATLSLGASDPARWPRDCTLDLTRATAVLQTPLPGVDELLAAQAGRRPPA